MISFRTSRRAILRIGAAALAFLGAAPLYAAANKTQEERPPEIFSESSSAETDFKTHMLYLRDVTITYGKMTVRADRATATEGGDFKNSRWTFNGNVRINAVPRGNLRSDEAIVEFKDKQLKRATATGKPAEFDQTGEDSNVIAHGHANEIVYEVGEATVRLSDDAWVTDGRNNITSPVITYSLNDERVQATTSQSTERIHVTIEPNDGPKDGKDGSGTNKAKTAIDAGKPPAAAQTAPQPASTPAAATPPASPPPAAASQSSTPH
jgi:lipopolysaccharide export system protein LptA